MKKAAVEIHPSLPSACVVNCEHPFVYAVFLGYASSVSRALDPPLRILRFLARKGAAVPGDFTVEKCPRPQGSVMILRRLVLSSRLHAVMAMTQGLPVAPVPEELLVTTMRNDVIDIRCLHEPSFLHALHAQRVCLKVLLPGFPPSRSVTSPRCGPHLFWM